VRLTRRDVAVIVSIHQHRVLRRDQIQRLLFPSKNTANERLKLLHQHGYLARHRLPVEEGQGSSQYLYMLSTRGAQLVAERLGVDIADIGWKRTQNHVSSPFLEHTLMVNDVRIAVELAARRRRYRLGCWTTEDELKRSPDRVQIEPERGHPRRVTLVPDAYFCLAFGQRRARFFLEADRATVPNRRWAQKILAYLAYVRSGAYARRYGGNSLRVLTVTTSEKRMCNLMRTTAKACGDANGARMFWFTWMERVTDATVLSAPIWHVPGQEEPARLISHQRIEVPALRGTPVLLFRS
jgi:hypothetical protein